MSDDLALLAKQHHAFYEVWPYYIVVQENHGSPATRTKKIQAGFDVDIYGVNIKDQLEFPESDPDYALGYTWLYEIAEDISHRTSGSCFLEVFSFPSTVVFDSRDHRSVEAMLRIRISHRRGLDEPAGEPEQQALAELENQLRGSGVARR